MFVRHEFESHDHAFKDVVSGEPDLLVSKQVNSALYGSPDLDAWLRESGIGSIALCGITTDHCVETTARMGANLGYDVLFVLDATHTFDRTGPDGTVMTADELARATATSLHEEFAAIVRTEQLAHLGRSAVRRQPCPTRGGHKPRSGGTGDKRHASGEDHDPRL